MNRLFGCAAYFLMSGLGCSADGSDSRSPTRDDGGHVAEDGSTEDIAIDHWTTDPGANDAGARTDRGTSDGPITDASDANARTDARVVDAPAIDVSTSDAKIDARADAVLFDGAGADAKTPPPGFWDPSGIPAAKNVMMFKFLNRTNGKYADSEVYWSFKSGSISETHSIAEQNMYDMPANSSGRMYFYLCAAGDATCASDPTKSKYYDFIEHTIGAKQYNGNTTRVDAFGLKIAMRMHCADNFETTVGEDYETFLEDRAVTFQKFIDFVPAEFKALAQPPHGPYRIVEPGAGGFNKGGMYESYYTAFIDQIWANNGITIAKAGANGSGLAAYPDLSAAIYRHVGATAGSFDTNGKLLNKQLWANAATFYTAAPANYYAQFWHLHAIDGKAYGFPYDDVGSYSSYISHSDPQYLMVAIGW